jgi:hypothetical protein
MLSEAEKHRVKSKFNVGLQTLFLF